MLIEWFITRYGWDAYRNASHPTSDHVIPAVWFQRLSACAEAGQARDQIQQATAVTHGIALAMSGKDGKVQAYHRKLRDAANPKIYPPMPDDAEMLTDG